MASENKDEMAEQTEFRPGQSVKVLQGNKVVQGVIIKKVISMDGEEEYMVELPSQIHRGRIGLEKVARRRILASRPGAPDTFAVEEGRVNVDGVEYRVLPYQLEYFKSDLAKFDDPKWRKQVVQQYLAKNYIKRFSRPGTPARFAVEDRFYFGKGRKERFAEPREIEAKIRAWIDSRGLPIGSQETNALSYIAAQHMIRGGVSIEQAVKSAARRHAQIGLASAGLRTWLKGNA